MVATNRPLPQLTVIFLMLFALLVAVNIAQKDHQPSESPNPVVDFPLKLGEWDGHSRNMDVGIADFLELSDYTIIDFANAGDLVNLYIAYYQTLKDGAFPHSPKLCIPGGGWEILDISGIVVGGYNIRRVLIEKDRVKQIVYYWYQQSRYSFSDEYSLKWNTFLRSFSDGRSDTSLVRLTIRIDDTKDVSEAEDRLAEFISLLDKEIGKRLH